MKKPSEQKIFAENIKREILEDLKRTYGGNYQQRHLIDSIKGEVLMDLDRYGYRQQSCPDRAFMDAVKDEALSDIQRELGFNGPMSRHPGYLDRATVESIKKEVIAQIKAEQEKEGKSSASEEGKISGQDHRAPDPALIQAVKDSVMAEINRPNYK